MPKSLLEWRLSAQLSKSIHIWLLTQEYHLLGVAGCRRSVKASIGHEAVNCQLVEGKTQPECCTVDFTMTRSAERQT